MSEATVSVWILGDQLLRAHPALAEAERRCGRAAVRVVLVESAGRAARLPYQRKKLVLLFSAMRHYAQRLRAAGWQVDYIQAATAGAGLRQHAVAHRPAQLITMAASEYGGRAFQRETLPALLRLPVDVLPNTQFLVGQYDPRPGLPPDKPYVMEHFYRAMRRRFALLMDGEQPAGGAWNFDRSNRKRLPASRQPPDAPVFPPDAITQAVMAEVEVAAHGVGTAEGFNLAVTHDNAQAALDDFIARRLPDFGPYEDAMTARHATLYHSALSFYLNIGLLEPLALARAAEEAYRAGRAPINSAEGLVRQVIGWREYIYWTYWRLMPGLRQRNAWGARRPLPAFFWTGDTEMNCLRHVVQRALATGYTHHIERLMVVCNFCLLAGIDPAQVNDWFLAAYADAYEWVMLPNVIGMGLNADGGLTATKPYIASASYINRMSDYCAGCRYDPQQRTGADACPFNALYWAFLIRNEAALRANPRAGQNVLGLRHLDSDARRSALAAADRFLNAL
ncbi:MAG: cryptochrome/photolyase family protein [Aggregatilineales bacterium]